MRSKSNRLFLIDPLQYRADPYSAKWSPVQAETLNEENGETAKTDSLLTATFKGAKFTAPSSPFTQRDAVKKTFKVRTNSIVMRSERGCPVQVVIFNISCI